MTRRHHPFRRGAGFTLIELLVAMAIGLVVTLAITSVLIRSEATKRTHTTVSDLDQNGAYAAYVLDRAIRSAGSGFSQSWSAVYGCLLDVSRATPSPASHVLPFPTQIASAWPTSAFATVTTTAFPIRLAPVIIKQAPATSTTGDILMVMAGTGGTAEMAQTVNTGSVTNTSVQLQDALGYASDDLVLLADPAVPAGCMVQQVASRVATTAGPNLPLGATTTPSYYVPAGTNVSLSSFGTSTIALQLGNAGNMPQFQLYGVGPNNTLMSMDLLTPVNSTTSPDVPIADGVVEMHALYGIDSTGVGTVDQWVSPSGTTYGASVLTGGTSAAQATLRKIVAIRVGLILRTSLQEKDPVIGPADPTTQLGTQPLTLTLFSDLSPATLQFQRTYAAGTTDLNYRYRTVEFTVPLRNVLLAP